MSWQGMEMCLWELSWKLGLPWGCYDERLDVSHMQNQFHMHKEMQ